MSDKRRGLGRGLGALIPDAGTAGRATERPVDVFFRDQDRPAVPNTVAGRLAATPTGNAAGAGSVGADSSGVGARDADQSQEGTSPGSVAGTHEGGPGAADAQPGGLAPVPGASFAEVPVAAIRPNPKQPRSVFDEDDMAELVHSIQEIGVLQPIVVRPVTGDDDIAYELIMGERRWRASREAGRETVPAIIKATEDDELLRDALLENLHRSNLNVLEEAAAYQQLLDDFGCTKEELAGRIGRSRPQISNTLRLLRLPPMVARRVAAGVLSAGHARALLTLDDGDQMERLAQRIVAEGLSVRTVEEIVALGMEPEKERRAGPRAGAHHPQLDDLAGRISDRLDTRVKINLGQRKGRMTIEFASIEDLHRVLGQMGVDPDHG
ncbi:ParB/RepB/Spo0J family partition protein [Janibacter terrae]|uniref:ParB/RepB/Spo0J family partition protein n=1 Tax=Janibacter terrae TaxID=103817 RepID=UPI00083670F1|nr:ParB/RepB/Spo0J family partition protein [Janibacter terrae]